VKNQLFKVWHALTSAYVVKKSSLKVGGCDRTCERESHERHSAIDTSLPESDRIVVKIKYIIIRNLIDLIKKIRIRIKDFLSLYFMLWLSIVIIYQFYKEACETII
jgi:hypothetical protein